MKTLVVDDNLVNRTSIEKIMEKIGEVEIAESGKDAIDLFELCLIHGNPFDLVLLDIVMPEMDGITVLKNLRHIEEAKKIKEKDRVKIVMVTSHAHKDIVMTAMKVGCDGYIVKPFERTIIIEKLKELNMSFTIKE